MYWLSVVTTLGFIGFFWLTSIERDMFFAIHTDPQEREEFVTRQQEHMPQPLAMISKGFGSLTASIGSVLGFDRSKGFDRASQQDTVYLLPLSK
jgi:hypothetical protein